MSHRATWRRAAALLAALSLLITSSSFVVADDDEDDDDDDDAPVAVQILALNDFHGQLEPLDAERTSSGRIGGLNSAGKCVAPTCFPAGGAEYLATHVKDLRATNPENTVFVSAGDLIGATPLLSALFHDEPTIEAFNEMGLDYNGVGNHEFDEGVDELLRMAYGSRPQGHDHDHDDDDDDDEDGGRAYRPARPDGCHPVDGCGDGDPFHGATFEFLAANVTYKDDGQPIFAPYAVHEFGDDLEVAFVGMTLEGTPLIVSPDGIASVNFLDEAAAVNALVPHLKDEGIEAIVVLLHEGGTVPVSGNGAGSVSAINSCTNPSGPIPPIVQAMDDEIDLVITGHTNWAVNCVIDGKVVTGAASVGRLVTDIDATLDPETGDFASITVNNRIMTRDVAKDAAMTALIAKYNAFAGPIAARQIGTATVALNRAADPGGDSVLGRLIADAQLAATAGPAGAQIAFMNPGGIRADLDAGPITYGEAFGVQPFANIVTTKTMTGAQIERLLEQQFRSSAGAARQTILQPSAGFTYTWKASGPLGDKVDPSTIKLNGVTLGASTPYRVTMNSFLATGGDDFPAFTEGTNEVTGSDDLVALEAYLTANDPYSPVTTSRITRVP